jgi:hypothetical protein
MCGVEAKPHTKQFIFEELTKVYIERYELAVSSETEFTVEWDIYEVI